MSAGDDCGGKGFLKLHFLSEAEPTQFDVLPFIFLEVDIAGVDIAMNHSISVDVSDSLYQLIEHSPNLLFLDPFSLIPTPMDKVGQSASLAVLHGDVDSDVLLIDFEVEVFEDVDVVHTHQSIYFLDDVLFLLGGNRREGYFLEDDCLLGLVIDCFEQVALFALDDGVFLVKHLQR